MYLNEKELIYFFCVTAFISGFFLFFNLRFFLLSPYTSEQWLAYHWWYAYHSLRNRDLDYLNCPKE
jgi:hypothetical protein